MFNHLYDCLILHWIKLPLFWLNEPGCTAALISKFDYFICPVLVFLEHPRKPLFKRHLTFVFKCTWHLKDCNKLETTVYLLILCTFLWNMFLQRKWTASFVTQRWWDGSESCGSESCSGAMHTGMSFYFMYILSGICIVVLSSLCFQSFSYTCSWYLRWFSFHTVQSSHSSVFGSHSMESLNQC